MSRKNRRDPIHVMTITSEQTFDMEKPRFNAHAVGHGAIQSKKAYTRTKKHRYQKEN